MERKDLRIIRQTLFAVLAAAALIGIDQFTKYLAVVKLKDQPPFDLIPGVFQFMYLENQGAAFGIFQGKKLAFLLLTVIFVGLLGFCYVRMNGERKFLPLKILSVVIFSGAVGNMIDRIWHNYVIDFFYFELIDFPVFNVADIYIVVSCIVFLILFLFYYKEEDFEGFFGGKGKKK